MSNNSGFHPPTWFPGGRDACRHPRTGFGWTPPAAGLSPGSGLNAVAVLGIVTNPGPHAPISRWAVDDGSFAGRSRCNRLCPLPLCALFLGGAGGTCSWRRSHVQAPAPVRLRIEDPWSVRVTGRRNPTPAAPGAPAVPNPDELGAAVAVWSSCSPTTDWSDRAILLAN